MVVQEQRPPFSVCCRLQGEAGVAPAQMASASGVWPQRKVRCVHQPVVGSLRPLLPDQARVHAWVTGLRSATAALAARAGGSARSNRLALAAGASGAASHWLRGKAVLVPISQGRLPATLARASMR